MQQTSVNSITTQKMIDEHVEPNTFTPLLHTLLDNVRKSQNQILEKFKLKFPQHETSISKIHLTKMHTDTGHSELVSQGGIPHCNEAL